jgi:nucleotide-binding universal stress UspA family protein
MTHMFRWGAWPWSGSWLGSMVRQPHSRRSTFAAGLANKYNAELVLLTAVPHLSWQADTAVDEYARPEHIQSPATELALATAECVLDGARRQARAEGASRISTEPTSGDPAQEIITTAQDRRAGSRGHGRLAGLLLGSVAQKVISLAPCPVVVVR